ncbi:MAG: hypothetical protein ACFFB5_09745 [Promethearchaeota archaeon]
MRTDRIKLTTPEAFMMAFNRYKLDKEPKNKTDDEDQFLAS